MKMIFTVNQLLKILNETVRTITKKEILSFYKITWIVMGKSIYIESVTQNFTGQTNASTNIISDKYFLYDKSETIFFEELFPY